MTETKPFSVGAILSITGEAMLCDIGDIYKILGWVTGEEDLMTHQLPRAARECEGFLREQFPDLAAVVVPKWTDQPGWGELSNDEKRDRITRWLDQHFVSEAGATRDVPRMPEQDHTRIDPLAELRMLRPDAPIIAIRATEDPS